MSRPNLRAQIRYEESVDDIKDSGGWYADVYKDDVIDNVIGPLELKSDVISLAQSWADNVNAELDAQEEQERIKKVPEWIDLNAS